MAYLMDFNIAQMNAFYWSAAGPDVNNNVYYAQDSGRVSHQAPCRMRQDPQRRRKRTTFSKAQLSELERAFSVTQYPDTKMKASLACLTGLPESKIQVWFQNRRARYFKNKKTTKDVPKSSTDLPQFTQIPSSPPPAQVSTAPSPLSIPSPPGYPAPGLPQSTRLSVLLQTRAPSLPTSTSPVSADQATSCPLDAHHGPHPNSYFEFPDFVDFFGDASLYNSLGEWDVPEELEGFLGDPNRSQPAGSRCDVVRHPEPKQSNQGTLDQDRSHRPEEDYKNDLSDLCLQDLGDFSLSDLDISTTMIDYILN